MALTYRSVKGSALTITELDNNFRHFTGSHEITASIGPVLISGSDGSNPALKITGSLAVTGSIFSQGLPTADPGVAGQLYNDSGTIKISL